MPPDRLQQLRQSLAPYYLADETTTLKKLQSSLQRYQAKDVTTKTQQLVASIQNEKQSLSLLETLLQAYPLNSTEGVVLMSLAEAFLRIPDNKTKDLLLQDKLSGPLWNGKTHSQHSSVLLDLVNQALHLAGAIEQQGTQPDNVYSSVLSRLGFPLIRSAINQAMLLLANQFVIAESITEAVELSNVRRRYSFDMLGEAALTEHDAERYFNAYLTAINHLALHAPHNDIYQNPGISIKLSALCPRYEPLQCKRAVQELSTKLLYLVKQARSAGISITLDAEECERLEMSLSVFQNVICNEAIKGWHGFGLAVQAYQKRAYPLIEWLAELAKYTHSRIPVRLVKGAYWDTEIKRAQEAGLSNYPVFIHKSATDISYLACAELLLSHTAYFYPQFATHNAHTICAIRQMASTQAFELQRLFGMGEQLYSLIDQTDNPPPCRIYAPVGHHHDLLPYLVRRLLENGANNSFINQLSNPAISQAEICQNPLNRFMQDSHKSILIPLPPALFGSARSNSVGLNLADPAVLQQTLKQLEPLHHRHWQATPLVNGEEIKGSSRLCYEPADANKALGEVCETSPDAALTALEFADQAFTNWRLSPVEQRTSYLLRMADLLETNRLELVSLCMREGGRTLPDALNEVREAVDYCRYYATNAMDNFSKPVNLPGPTGEMNQLRYYGRGVFLCISPWNFPLAIFLGQISAALAAGNCVLAKPARQTPLLAMRCIQLFHQAGVPPTVLHFLPGSGNMLGKVLLTDPRIAGVVFTGSTSTAGIIQQQLAKRPAIIPFIAETGGQNVMIADSTAHCEQLVQDVINSAFNSAGQRCSALRVLYLQNEITDKVISLLTGAMLQLNIGFPQDSSTDIGPLISEEAVKIIRLHIEQMQTQGKILYQMTLPSNCDTGNFIPPTIIELASLNQLREEVFGPVLHIIRFSTEKLNTLIEDINHCGYGLTLGIQSRIQSRIDYLHQHLKIGNVYVNRNMIGAVVGVQPFGGMGLSGTGPKAGGPNYLQRFAVEQTVTVNTAAIGGNIELLSGH
jgi:RHH-type transcriptional regulator, proline utilization regulon repressor / proline dehydrogenase / delta 1-pyrroline-5-carboxylate dehydrogenase